MDGRSPAHVARRASADWGFCLIINDLHSTVLRFLAAGARYDHLDATPPLSGSYKNGVPQKSHGWPRRCRENAAAPWPALEAVRGQAVIREAGGNLGSGHEPSTAEPAVPARPFTILS